MTRGSLEPSDHLQFKPSFQINHIFGAIAQLARAPALQAGGPGFESPLLHQEKTLPLGGVFSLVATGGSNPAQGPGEKCQWHFARQPTLEN